MALAKSCRTCRYFPIEKVTMKSGRVRFDKSARCQFPVEKLTVPFSMRSVLSTRGKIEAGRVLAGDGADCPTFEEKQNG